ncbi:MAG: hypothetical protein PHO48_02570 [Candidatus Gracilibacteria bacterium]|nr:hypothetical protein [Candidatus Gracilibacteria bacterium]MDD5179421.1 hypothetical protein [Candidatus Gracilibacteria bacterium]
MPRGEIPDNRRGADAGVEDAAADAREAAGRGRVAETLGRRGSVVGGDEKNADTDKE